MFEGKSSQFALGELSSVILEVSLEFFESRVFQVPDLVADSGD